MMAFLAAGVLAGVAQGQQVVDSAAAPSASALQTLPEARPAERTVSGFVLTAVRFNGAALERVPALQALVASDLGRHVALADLDDLARRVADWYHGQGLFLAQAIVPAQAVRGGVVEISVVEGRLGKISVSVADDAPISEARVRAYLSSLQPDAPLDIRSYERAMLLLSDLPGIAVQSGLQEGTQPGATDLVVEVSAARRWSFVFDADNHGTLESGRYRAGGTIRWASPLGIGDNLDASVMMTNGNNSNVGRLAYEAPAGTGGLRLGASLARVAYDLGGVYSDLGATGTARIAELSASYPLIRQREQNLLVRWSADTKQLTDRLDEFDYRADKRVVGTGLALNWEKRDDWLGGGYWSGNGTLYYGSLRLKDAAAREQDSGPGGLHTAGGFLKFTWQLSRLQAVLPRHSLYLSVGGQQSNKNLDASEKLALGGARAVRGYPSSELLVDEGVLGSVEWRWSATETLTPYLFYDIGRGRVWHTPEGGGANRRTLSAAGLGVSWSQPGNFLVNVSLGWRLNAPAETDGSDKRPRIYAQIQKRF